MAEEVARYRAQWTEAETFVLIRVWQDHLCDLRRTKRNAKVYSAIEEALRAEGIEKGIKAIKSKMENLGNKYRELSKKNTGQGAIVWKFYWDLHKFLGTLPANDSSLAQETGCHLESTAEELFRNMVDGEDTDQYNLESSQSPAACRESAHLDQCAANSSEPLAENISQRQSPCGSMQPPTTRRGRQQKENFFGQLIEEQRRLRISFENSKDKEFSFRERELKLQEAAAEREIKAAEREDRLIDVLSELCKK